MQLKNAFDLNRLAKNLHAARSWAKNRLKLLMYGVYGTLSRRFLPCLTLA
jgi:hypothetical protein